MKKLLEQYLKNLTETLKRGDAREESFYKYLDDMIKQFAEFQRIKNIEVTILPKRTEAGNPDFRIWDGKNHITGYIEAKDPSVTNLDYVEETKQLERYLSTFPNVILTNFYEFRLYRDNRRIAQVMIARPIVAKKLQTTPPLENIEKFKELFDLFFSFSLPKVQTARSLAIELARRTRFLRDEVISVEMEENDSKGHKQIMGFYEAFNKYLIATLTEKQFADLYAQTITYGLFAARTRAEGEFNRKLAFDFIPHTIGILRDVFRFISLEDQPKSLQIIVEDIVEILNAADTEKILREYHRAGKGRDPIIHFYETFLATYDPEVRERRGVYYTPEPVVGYIVRSIHSLLKSHFNLADGLASEEVKLLDPAGGTLTFPAEAIRLAADEFTKKYGSGGLHRWISKHILADFYSFELMMAPYAIGHLKISLIFNELGYKMADDERFKLYLTNTLEMEEIKQIAIPGLSSLSEESYMAGKVKKEQPVLVILGNPPYSGFSENPSITKSNVNKGAKYISDYFWNEQENRVEPVFSTAKKDMTISQRTFIGSKLMDYYYVDGQPLGEKNPKWLQNDYVKFLRYSQWKIQQSGQGIVGMITDNSYLDSPTFRGMRQSLIKTFDEIYLIDLHGNSNKKETAPYGGKDENVFDIRQGVAIALFVKNLHPKIPQVFHIDLYGVRDEKYRWLETNEFDKNKYSRIQPQSPYYFLVKKNTEKIQRYLDWRKISEIFMVNNVGIVTARDKLAIKWSEHEMWNTILNFVKLEPELARQAYDLGKDARDWKVEFAQKDLLDSGPQKSNIQPILYRPFDGRYTYYTGKSRGFQCMPRPEVMGHMLKENIGIIVPKRVETQMPWQHCFCGQSLIDHVAVSLKTIDYVFPLYLYPKDRKENTKRDTTIMMIFEPQETYGKKPNITPEIYKTLNSIYKKKPSPEEILCYIYGVLYCNIYRETYAEFLKIDFPRVPFTADYSCFKKIGELGQKLVDFHLLKIPALGSPVAKYQGHGPNDKIEKITYDKVEQRIYINKDKYFENITPEVWSYQIGGYQVLQKYLKDRTGRNMDDAPRYCRIVTALSKTIEIQKQIDLVYPEVEKELVQF